MELGKCNKTIMAKDQQLSNSIIKINSLEQELNQTKLERDGLATTVRILHHFPGNYHNINATSNLSYAMPQDFIDGGNIAASGWNSSYPARYHDHDNLDQVSRDVGNIGQNDNSRRRRQGNRNKTRTNGESNNQTFTTVIVGDSIVKNIQGFKIGRKTNSRVIVKPYSGATTADMHHHVIPTIQRKPDQIVLHTGTNDLQTTEPHQIAENIVDLAREIENKAENDVKVVISLLTARRGCQNKVKTVNKHLKRFAVQNGWSVIDNHNINEEDLNFGGVHLKEQGTNKLFNNFVRFISTH